MNNFNRALADLARCLAARTGQKELVESIAKTVKQTGGTFGNSSPQTASKVKISEPTRVDYQERILRVLAHIQRRLDDGLNLEQLARIACFSTFHFHRIFTAMTGESLKDHVRRLRLERAAVQLRVSKEPVTQIAFQAGYESHEAFTRAFKSAYGVAPIRFRMKKSPIPVLSAPSGVHYRAGEPLQNFKIHSAGVHKMNVTIKETAPMLVAFIRHIGRYDLVGETWKRLVAQLARDGRIGRDSTFIGIPHDDPEATTPETCRYDACVTVDDQYVPTGEVRLQTIPGGEYAVATHSGPSEKIGETYAKLFGQWLPRSGRELRSSPSFVIALNNPQTVVPEDLLADIYLPLQPEGARAQAGT